MRDKVGPSSYLGFVVQNDSAEFKYDADSQVLALTLSGTLENFVMDNDHPTLDGVLIRRGGLSRDKYLGSNAFGASVVVDRSYGEEYGVAFSRDNRLFGSAVSYPRDFTYLLPMVPEEAKSAKAFTKILVICRLADPWVRETMHGHEPTIDEPNSTIVQDDYLQVIPEELWLFNQKTCAVILKLSESSVMTDKDQQLALKLRQTPLILEVSTDSRIVSSSVTIDDGPEEPGDFSKDLKTYTAKRQIVINLMLPQYLSDLRFTLNGKPYTPNWTTDMDPMLTNYVRSATAVITVP